MSWQSSHARGVLRPTKNDASSRVEFSRSAVPRYWSLVFAENFGGRQAKLDARETVSGSMSTKGRICCSIWTIILLRLY